MMPFHERITRLLLLLLILFLVVISVIQMRIFLPGLLGALTLYILSRRSYFYYVYQKKWRKGFTAFIFVIAYLVLLGIPVMLMIKLVSPKLQKLMEDPGVWIKKITAITQQLKASTGINWLHDFSTAEYSEKIVGAIPVLLNSSVTLISNLAIMLFLLYYMFYNGSEMEKQLYRFIPLQDDNTSLLAAETRKMVTANALGIPIISAIQGAAATLGYYLFGIEEYALFGFLTGVFAFFPIIGTLVIWVPLVVYLYSIGENGHAWGLLIYSAIVTGNIDYVARITIMRRIGDIHPVITVLGIIVGLGLFGFIGIIFGPLLISYIIILTRIYKSEFVVTNGKG
ncbi:AI-2E family transporter [Lacibacter sp. H375]|uniref:AI-2E family transporter n=1 Tax=Lacibacter sp. H375 TaxID=3133424 RepID=UPI0030C58F99